MNSMNLVIDKIIEDYSAINNFKKGDKVKVYSKNGIQKLQRQWGNDRNPISQSILFCSEKLGGNPNREGETVEAYLQNTNEQLLHALAIIKSEVENVIDVTQLNQLTEKLKILQTTIKAANQGLTILSVERPEASFEKIAHITGLVVDEVIPETNEVVFNQISRVINNELEEFDIEDTDDQNDSEIEIAESNLANAALHEAIERELITPNNNNNDMSDNSKITDPYIYLGKSAQYLPTFDQMIKDFNKKNELTEYEIVEQVQKDAKRSMLLKIAFPRSSLIGWKAEETIFKVNLDADNLKDLFPKSMRTLLSDNPEIMKNAALAINQGALVDTTKVVWDLYNPETGVFPNGNDDDQCVFFRHPVTHDIMMSRKRYFKIEKIPSQEPLFAVRTIQHFNISNPSEKVILDLEKVSLKEYQSNQTT